MGKPRKGKAKKSGRKSKSRYSDYNISPIEQHKQHGTRLSPPLTQIPKMTTSSWSDDHMPEMLWAVLLTGVLERSHYLSLFRSVANLCREWFKKDESGGEKLSEKPENETGIDYSVVADHTKLAEISDEEFLKFISIPLSHPLGPAALRPLLLIESLPGFERWKRVLNLSPTDHDFNTLAKAVSGVLDHQSEKSTDIRWFKLILPIISGRMFFPESMADELEALRLFPDKGDMRHVRPFIRSGEMTLRRNPTLDWVQVFWADLLKKTRCLDPSRGEEHSFVEARIDPNSLYAARDGVIGRFMQNLSAKRVDARLDSAFGLVLYALSIVEEICRHFMQTRIMGRLALRALVEANITFQYLAKKDSEALWASYRVYGAGQAKLAFLKAQQLEGDLPPFLDEDALYAIANEDIWQEFLTIDVGHWANSNLRKLSIDCGAKGLYDKYYDWISAFAHSHWGAVRDTNLVTCHNPLHRLHRIPRLVHRNLSSVEIDAIEMTNEMLGVLDRLFPGEDNLGELSLQANQTSPDSK